MMRFINHRINTVTDLDSVPFENGIELDVRYHNDELILHHDPFQHHKNNPEKLDYILEKWKHNGPLIINIKTEGIEKECISMMDSYEIKNWFFLDMSMPFLVKYSLLTQGANPILSPKNLAVRFSEFEPLEYALSFTGKAGWVWIDCFNKLPLTHEIYKQLKQSGFKICLVSPELQGHSLKQIPVFKDLIQDMEIDAICTKRQDLWV